MVPLLARSFGSVDKKFAVHQQDEDNAFKYLQWLRKHNKGWKSVQKDIQEYLKDCNERHIEVQTGRAETMLKPWILD